MRRLLFVLFGLLVLLGPVAADDVEMRRRFEAAGDLLRLGRYHEAERRFREIVEETEDRDLAAQAMFLTARAEESLGRYEAAIQTYGGLTRRFAGSVWAEQASEKISDLEGGRRYGFRDLEDLLRIEQAYAGDEAAAGRVTALEHFLSVYPDSAASGRAQAHLAEAYRAVGRLADAETAYERAVQLLAERGAAFEAGLAYVRREQLRNRFGYGAAAVLGLLLLPPIILALSGRGRFPSGRGLFPVFVGYAVLLVAACIVVVVGDVPGHSEGRLSYPGLPWILPWIGLPLVATLLVGRSLAGRRERWLVAPYGFVSTLLAAFIYLWKHGLLGPA